MYRACRMTFAPVLINFSRSVVKAPGFEQSHPPPTPISACSSRTQLLIPADVFCLGLVCRTRFHAFNVFQYFVFYPLNFANYDFSLATRIPHKSHNLLKHNGFLGRVILAWNLLCKGLKKTDRKANYEDRSKAISNSPNPTEVGKHF